MSRFQVGLSNIPLALSKHFSICHSFVISHFSYVALSMQTQFNTRRTLILHASSAGWSKHATWWMVVVAAWRLRKRFCVILSGRAAVWTNDWTSNLVISGPSGKNEFGYTVTTTNNCRANAWFDSAMEHLRINQNVSMTCVHVCLGFCECGMWVCVYVNNVYFVTEVRTYYDGCTGCLAWPSYS